MFAVTKRARRLRVVVRNVTIRAAQMARLERLGVKVSSDQLYTSTQATIEYLRSKLPRCRRLFVLGTQSLIGELTDAGFESVTASLSDGPDAVLVGFDATLSYARLCRAAWWIVQGKPFIATHPDRVCPTDKPTVLVDCGAICAALREATGRPPDAVSGKPDPCMIRGVLRRQGPNVRQLAVVGDGLYTDMVMARDAGALGVLVLTGETTAANVRRAVPPPDMVVCGLSELAGPLRRIHNVNSAG